MSKNDIDSSVKFKVNHEIYTKKTQTKTWLDVRLLPQYFVYQKNKKKKIKNKMKKNTTKNQKKKKEKKQEKY